MGTRSLTRVIRKWEDDYEWADLEEIIAYENGDNNKACGEGSVHYFIFRHCPACHNKVGLKKKMYANMGIRGNENAAIGMSSMCLKGTYEDFSTKTEIFSKFFEIIWEYVEEENSTIEFGSSIIFRDILTCSFLIASYQNKIDKLGKLFSLTD